MSLFCSLIFKSFFPVGWKINLLSGGPFVQSSYIIMLNYYIEENVTLTTLATMPNEFIWSTINVLTLVKYFTTLILATQSTPLLHFILLWVGDSPG